MIRVLAALLIAIVLLAITVVILPIFAIVFVAIFALFMVVFLVHWVAGKPIIVYQTTSDEEGNESKRKIGEIRRFKYTKYSELEDVFK